MHNKYHQEIVIAQDQFKTLEEYIQYFGNLIFTLNKLEYDCFVRYEDCDITVIEYNYQDSEYSDIQHMWVTTDEAFMIEDKREQNNKVKQNES